MKFNKENQTINLEELLQSGQMIDPVSYQYYKNLSNRILVINDEINCDIIETAILPLLEWDNDGSNKPIKIFLNSNGGDVYHGMTLCSVIENLKCPIVIIILSLAASMGSLIAASGYKNPNVKTVCYPFTVFLFHSGSYYFEGNANAVRDSFAFQEDYEKKITDYILSHTTISKDTYEKKTRVEWYLTAEQALNYGIVDEII